MEYGPHNFDLIIIGMYSAIRSRSGTTKDSYDHLKTSNGLLAISYAFVLATCGGVLCFLAYVESLGANHINEPSSMG